MITNSPLSTVLVIAIIAAIVYYTPIPAWIKNIAFIVLGIALLLVLLPLIGITL